MHLARSGAPRRRAMVLVRRRRRAARRSRRRSAPTRASTTCGRSGLGTSGDRRASAADERRRARRSSRRPRRGRSPSSGTASREWVAEGLFQGQGDSPLSDLGQRQALLTARRIARRAAPPGAAAPRRARRAASSTPRSPRAAETAALIARAVSSAAATTRSTRRCRSAPSPGFLEIGQGEWEGLPARRVVERWGELLEQWRRDPLTAWAPGGESLAGGGRSASGVALRDAARGPRTVAAPPAPSGRSQVLGYGDLPSGRAVVDRRRPRRRVQGRAAGAARPAARTLLDPAVRAVRDHDRRDPQRPPPPPPPQRHGPPADLETDAGPGRARGHAPESAAGRSRASRSGRRRQPASAGRRRDAARTTPMIASRSRWYASAIRCSRSDPRSRLP